MDALTERFYQDFLTGNNVYKNSNSTAGNTKSAYQQNAFKPVETKTNVSATRSTLGKIMKIAKYDLDSASELMGEFTTLQQNPSSKYYNPYTQATNRSVSNLSSLGIDTSKIDSNWFESTKWLDDYLVYNGTTNTPSSPGKKATTEQNAAYERYQIGKANELTNKAKTEWAALQEETSYWAKRTDLNYSDDEILDKIYGKDGSNFSKKYPTLAKMDESLQPGGTLLELNEGIDYSKDNLYGVLWAARNGGGTGSTWQNTAYSALGEGNVWKENQDIAAKLNKNDISTYNPHAVGMTLDEEGLYFNTPYFTQSMIDDLKKNLDWEDSKAVEMINNVQDAEDFTVKAESELTELTAKVDEWIANGWSEDTIIKNLDRYMNKNCSSLQKMDKGINARDPVKTTRAIDYKYDDLKQSIHDRLQENENNPSGIDYTCDEIDAVTSAAPLSPRLPGSGSENDNSASVPNKNNLVASTGVSDSGIKLPSQQEREVYKAQDAELKNGLASVDGELNESESAQMKNAGTVAWEPMKDIWQQATQLPYAIIGLANKNATGAAKLYVEGSVASQRIVDNYNNVQSNLERDQSRFDELHDIFGDIEYLQDENKLEPRKTIEVGDITFVLDYNDGDFANNVAPGYRITDFYAPGRGGGETMEEILEYGQDQDKIDQAEEIRKEESAKALKVVSAQNRAAALGEEGEGLLNEYKSVYAAIQREQEYLETNKEEYEQNNKLLNNVTKNYQLVDSTNHMLGADTTKLEQAQAITGYLTKFYDEPQLYNSPESMTQYYDGLLEVAGENMPYTRTEWNRLNIDSINRQLGYLDMSEEWIAENDVKLPDNVVKNMKYTREDLNNKRTAYEYASIISDTDSKEFEAVVKAGKDFENKYDDGDMHYWTNLFEDNDYYTLKYQERYNDPDTGEMIRDVVSEEDENLYYYLLGKKVLEMGDSLDNVLSQINTDPELAHAAVSEVFSDALKYQKFMEDENTGYGLWSIREYDKSTKYAEDLVNSGFWGGVLANAMSTLVTPAESIGSIYGLVDQAISGKRFNTKSFTGRISGFKNTTRAETRESINNTFGEDTFAGKLANLGYEIYCNRGDSLMNSMVFGSLFNTKIAMVDEFLGASPMGATAAMNAAVEAVNNGASTDQAWFIAGVTFFAETATEAITLSNIKESMGITDGISKDTIKDITKKWLTESGIEEMVGESLNDIIENAANQAAADWFDNPNFQADHDKLVDKYFGEGMSRDDAEAAAYRDEIKGVLHTALVSYLSSGTEVLTASGKAFVNSYNEARTQTEGTDQSAISKMYENWKAGETDERAERLEADFAKREEKRELAEEAQVNEQQKEYATDIEILETATGATDAFARTSAAAAVLVTENTKKGNDVANATAIHVEDAFENGMQDVQEILYGGMVNDQNIIALRRGIQYAVIGGAESVCSQVVQSESFKTADPSEKAKMIGEAVTADMWNNSVAKNVEAVVRENRIAEREKELIANGALQETQKAQQEVFDADAADHQAQEDLEVKQGEAEAASQALDAAVTANNENPSDENTKEVISTTAEVGRRDESVKQYEQHKANMNAALEKAEAACNDTKQKELASVRQQAEQDIDAEDQKIAEQEAKAAEQERIEIEVRQKALAEQQLNNNVSRMDADDFINQYYPDATDEEKKTIRNAFVKTRFEMGYTAEGFLQRKSFTNAIEKKFGLTVKVGDTTEGGKVVRKNAQIDKKNGVILLDTTATMDDMFYAIMCHEVTHGAEKSKTYGELADAVLQCLYGNDASYQGVLDSMKSGDVSSQLAQDILAKKRLYDSKVGGDHTYEEMAQEVVADGVGKILSGDQAAMDQLVAEKPSIAKRILSSIRNFLRKAAGLEGVQLTKAQQIADLLEQKLKDAGFTGEQNTNNTNNKNTRYSVATESAIVQDDDGTPLAQEFDDGTAVVSPENFQYSLSSFDEDEQERVRQALLKKFPEEDVDRYMEDALGIAALIATDKVRWDFDVTDPNKSMFKPNADYGGSIDASTLCAKRLVYQGTFDAIQHALPNTPLLPSDLIHLSDMMREMGYETPCGICYVESRRRNLDTYIAEWLKDFKGTANDSFVPTIADVSTTDGLEEVRKNHPETYKAFMDAMNSHGKQNNPKPVQLRTEYKGEISGLSDKQVQKYINHGGIRLQSFSDFETPHLLDMMQVVMDIASKNLTAQAYTKVPNFAWAFGDTGIKINLSLIGKGEGVDENGNLIFDDVEGMPFAEAMALRDRYSKNVGTILVGINDRQILAAMADPRIDYIIPFHSSGWTKEDMRLMPTLEKYTDYQNFQTEKDLDTGAKTKKNGGNNIAPVGAKDDYGNGYWDFNKSGKENAQAYLDICFKNKLVPVFSQFLDKGEDGHYYLKADGSTDGYWKLLIDFKMYENGCDGSTGEVKGSPQLAVTPDVNMAEAYRIMNDYDLTRVQPGSKTGLNTPAAVMKDNNSLPVAQEVVDRFVEEYKQSHPLDENRTRYSLPSDQELDAFFDDYIENMSAEELDQLAQELFGVKLNSSSKESTSVNQKETGVENTDDFAGDLNEMYKEAVASGDIDAARNIIGKIANAAGYTVYGTHRTNGEFTVFERNDETGKRGATLGDGFYIAAGEGTEYDNDHYGKKRMLVYVNPGKVFDIQEHGLTKRQANKVYDKYFAPHHSDAANEKDSPYRSHVIGKLQNGYRVMDYIKEAAETNNITTDKIFKELGYDSIKDGPQYCVFDSSQIKLADPITYDDQGNTISSGERFDKKNPDIRYSLPSDAPYLSAVNHGNTEDAQMLVDNAAEESMQDSKVRDEYGNLLKVYHGTSEDFTVFDMSKGRSTMDIQGSFFSPWELEASGYGENVRAYYLNIQNPADEGTAYAALRMFQGQNEAGRKAKDYLISQGYDGVITGVPGQIEELIAFYPEQIKSADPVTYDDEGNEIPLSERFNTAQQDIRYSLPSENILNDQIRYYLENQNAPQEEMPTITQQLNPAEETKQRQWGREGAQQSDELAEQAKQYVLEHNEYYPDTNAEQLDRAIEWIRSNSGGTDATGYYTSLQKVTSKNFNYRSADGQAKMIAVMGMAVAQNDVSAQVQLSNLYNQQGTTLGQALQARKLWKLMTPEGRVQSLNNMLKTSQDELDAKGSNITLKLSDWIYMAATAATQDGAMEAVQKAAAQEIAEQLPANWRDKLRSWRMLSMLGNPRTHIRNIIGNALFIPAVGLKNKIGAIGEIISNQETRTKTLSLFLNKDIRNFAREDAVKMKDTLTGEAKYNENNAVQKEQKAFNGLLQAIIDYNSNKLEQEDWFFLKGHYRRALGGWMQANGYTVDQLKSKPSLLEQGRAYAIEEAQKATYRDFNQLAATLNKVSRDGGVAGFIVDATLPFKKTPANILKRGIEYSPVGLMKSLTSDIYHLKQWNDAQDGKLNETPEKAISPTQFIDKLSSGLAGSAVLAIGALLGSAGIITCGLDDDEDELEKAKGAQKYAIKILGTDVTFTIDWAAPMSMPLFVGAALQEQLSNGGEFNAEGLVNAIGNITEPVFNLSMLDGVNSLFKTSQYDDTNTLTQIGAKVASNYVTSYVPSLLGAIARTVDDTQRKSYVESGKGTGVLGTFRYAREQVENKIPGWSQTNISVRDVWGNANTSSLAERILENFILPGYVNEYKDDPIINEMARLYDITGDSAMIPSDPSKSVTYKKQKYVLSAEEWDTYKETRGQTAYQSLSELINSSDYMNADPEVQTQMIKNVWSYADKVGKSVIIPNYDMDEINDVSVTSIAKDSKISGYENEMLKALNAEDYVAYDTMIEALHREGVEDSTIKTKIGNAYRDKYKEAYKKGDVDTMSEIEKILLQTDFDFDIEKWEQAVDEKRNR